MREIGPVERVERLHPATAAPAPVPPPVVIPYMSREEHSVAFTKWLVDTEGLEGATAHLQQSLANAERWLEENRDKVEEPVRQAGINHVENLKLHLEKLR